MVIEFDPKTHTYVVDGKKLPSVTQVMKRMSDDSYSGIPSNIMEVASDRGSRVHKAIDDYISLGEFIDEDDVKPYFKGFLNAVNELGLKILSSEKLLTNGVFCGTVDAIVEFKGKRYLVDWKTTTKIHENLVSIQFAGYRELCAFNGIHIDGSMVIQLNKTTKSGFKHRIVKEDEFTWWLLLEEFKEEENEKAKIEKMG